eukprot:RCo040676
MRKRKSQTLNYTGLLRWLFPGREGAIGVALRSWRTRAIMCGWVNGVRGLQNGAQGLNCDSRARRGGQEAGFGHDRARARGGAGAPPDQHGQEDRHRNDQQGQQGKQGRVAAAYPPKGERRVVVVGRPGRVGRCGGVRDGNGEDKAIALGPDQGCVQKLQGGQRCRGGAPLRGQIHHDRTALPIRDRHGQSWDSGELLEKKQERRRCGGGAIRSDGKRQVLCGSHRQGCRHDGAVDIKAGEGARGQNASILELNRTVVGPHNCSEGGNLRLRGGLNRGGHDPVDDLRARRRRQRPGVLIELRAKLRDELVHNVRIGDVGGFFVDVREQHVQQCIGGGSNLKKQADHGERRGCPANGGVRNEVQLHVVVLAVHCVLRRGVEVELHSTVDVRESGARDSGLLAANEQLQGVAVVLPRHHRVWGERVVNLEVTRGSERRVGEVDRGLAGASTVRVFLVPVRRPVGRAAVVAESGKSAVFQQQNGEEKAAQCSHSNRYTGHRTPLQERKETRKNDY